MVLRVCAAASRRRATDYWLSRRLGEHVKILRVDMRLSPLFSEMLLGGSLTKYIF